MWNAKPNNGYIVNSDEWVDNVNAFYEYAKNQYTLQAICGMIGNSQGESGLNPWRWQSDTVDYDGGYGLFQYTPASGYIEEYGKKSSYYAPNLSTTSQTSGSYPTDAIAQIEVIGESGKYGGSQTRIERIKEFYPQCVDYTTLNEFKKINDLYGAVVCWLGFFEAPKIINQNVIDKRYEWSLDAYNVLKERKPFNITTIIPILKKR